MRMPEFLRRALLRRAGAIMARRSPDYVIGGHERPYLERWWVIPRNRFLNLYLHRFVRSDDDRALHDHPWVNASLLLDGRYLEWLPAEEGLHRVEVRSAGDVVCRGAAASHRVELVARNAAGDLTPVITLFCTGPRLREWGFWCPGGRWVHWRDFTAPGRSNEIGPGCDGPASLPGKAPQSAGRPRLRPVEMFFQQIFGGGR